MAKVTPVSANKALQNIRPGLTPEADENQMIALAINLVKQRLIDGTASSQETTHFLKLSTTEARLKNKLLEAQAAKALAQKEELESRKTNAELLEKAMAAFKSYVPNQSAPSEDDYDEY